MMRLNIAAFGVAAGTLWGGAIFVTTLVHLAAGWFEPCVRLLTGTYPGYGPTFFGALAGLIAGFIDGLLFGVIFALLYNALAAKRNQAEGPPSNG